MSKNIWYLTNRLQLSPSLIFVPGTHTT